MRNSNELYVNKYGTRMGVKIFGLNGESCIFCKAPDGSLRPKYKAKNSARFIEVEEE